MLNFFKMNCLIISGRTCKSMRERCTCHVRGSSFPAVPRLISSSQTLSISPSLAIASSPFSSSSDRSHPLSKHVQKGVVSTKASQGLHFLFSPSFNPITNSSHNAPHSLIVFSYLLSDESQMLICG